MFFPEEPLQHITHPVLIKNKINGWKVLKYGEKDWCDLFQNKILSFRQGDNLYRENPYWDQLCQVKEITLETFFELSKERQDHWLYLDYKHVKDIVPNVEQLNNDIRWADINVPNLSGQDSTLWIGNNGAHTPCHMDTYGCNFVAQVFGRKLWILMPPEETENLNPTRVPYEESSIYSCHNFYTPNLNLKG